MTKFTIRGASLWLVGVILLIPGTAVEQPRCAELGTNPAYGLAGNPAVTRFSATSVPLTQPIRHLHQFSNNALRTCWETIAELTVRELIVGLIAPSVRQHNV